MFQSVLSRLRDSETAELEGMGAAEAGFTLIELMVVLLIIAILLAIAIPTFLGVTSSANDRAAQSNLTNGLTEAAAQYQGAGQTYSGVSAALSSSAPEYTWNASATACTTSTPNCISVFPVDLASATDQQGVILASMSKTGTCWWVAQLQAAPVVLASPGFVQTAYNATHAAGMQIISGANVATAGTYYGKKANAGNCSASFVESAPGFNWGTSYSTAGIN
jgi:prepilin-type N-terminal cleavage/methylation domain-containing protein